MAPSRGAKAKSIAATAKAAQKNPATAASMLFVATSTPLVLQQRILSAFASAFTSQLASDLQPLLQQVKQHLYNRDFDRAFGQEEYCAVYAARWCPSRALCYLDLFADLLPYLLPPRQSRPIDSTNSNELPPVGLAIGDLAITCLGGGAGAELAACGGLLALQQLLNEDPQYTSSTYTAFPGLKSAGISSIALTLVDNAPWSTTLSALTAALVGPQRPPSPPSPSRFISTSSAAEVPSQPLVPEPDALRPTFQQVDLLDASSPASSAVDAALRSTRIATLLFTLNELYAASVPATQALLGRITVAMPAGALLLVVDSPGSYARVALRRGGEDKDYPMHFLLDYALLSGRTRADEADGGEPAWVKLVEVPSRWFRLTPGTGSGKETGKARDRRLVLQYPIKLEDMRFQMHLYRRL